MKRFAVMLFVLSALALSPPGASAQFVQQGSKLVGTGAVGSAFQGASVAISGDGNTAIVGGWVDSNETGAAWVYTRSGDVWSQQGSKLVGTDAVGSARQAISVAISADGNTAIVGGIFDSSSAGAAWVFARSGGVWSQQGSKLVGSGSAGHAGLGASVALAADGNTAIIGGDFDDNHTGAGWVFTRSGGVWSQQGSKLVGTGAVGRAEQGAAVSVSGDGNTAILGGYADSGDVGAAWVFIRSGGVWSQQGSKLVGTGAAGIARQGVSVSVSSDGNTTVVGGYLDSNFTGAAWVFTRSGGVWSQQGSKLAGSDAERGDFGVIQGYSVAVSGDGNTAILGGYLDSNFTGAAWMFTRSGGVWSQLGNKLVGTGAAGKAEQGVSVALSADGNTAIVGGFADDNSAGAAWVYARAVTDVRELDGEVPLQFGLAQNFPNPFNPTTIIRFELPASANVRLSLFDLLGREAAVIVNERKNAGVYEVIFDGSNLATGVYFCRLQTAASTTTRRLVLVR